MAGGAGGARPVVDGGSAFIRWAKLGVWQRLLELAQEGRVQLGMAFLDGSSIRAHHKAAGARKRGDLRDSEIAVKRLADLVEATEPKRV